MLNQLGVLFAAVRLGRRELICHRSGALQARAEDLA
jgi:hypothetical protein